MTTHLVRPRGRGPSPAVSWAKLLLITCVALVAALVPTQSAFAVASSQPVTAILQGASQNGWVTDTQLRAEYSKWAAYPNVVPAFRSTSANKDEAKMVGWESAGLNYFYTAISSDYRFGGSMYAAAGAPEAVLARPNNKGLYVHQLLTQLTADSGWAWQTGIGKTNWALVDQWVMKAQSLGKKVVWNEPSHAWDEVKKNATALGYFNKWKSTVVVTYGTNFPDQVDSWAKPGAAALASAAGSLRGASIQAFNFTDRSVAVTRAGVKSLVDGALTNGSTYLEFSGANADLQPGSQLLLGAQDALAAPPTQPAPKQNYPGDPAFTAILMGSSQKGWTTETQQRAEYAKWITYPNVRPAFRSMAYSKNDALMTGWERDGYKYFWTAASSDFYPGQSSIYVPSADASEVLGRSNNLGLYLHEVISHQAAHNGWDWRKSVWDTDWARIGEYVEKARALGKKVIWSEPSHAWAAVYNDAAARDRIRGWDDTLVVTFATNFPDQINDFSKPGAQALAAEFGGSLGDSIQSWHWFDQMSAGVRKDWNLTPGGAPTPAATAAAAKALADDGVASGARYFQFEGTAPDMQVASPYMTGVRQFLDSLKSRTPAPFGGQQAERVPIYAAMNLEYNDQALLRSPGALGSSYYDQGIVGYVLDRPAAGTVPLTVLWSPSATDYFYTADPVEVKRATGRDTSDNGIHNWAIRYNELGTLGYVYPEVYGDTVPLYQVWNNAADTNDHAYTASSWIKGKYNSVGYEDQRIAAYLFDNDGRQTKYPLVQMWNSGKADHFYTANSDEVRQYRDTLGFEVQKNVGMMLTEPVGGAVPLYEAYSAQATDHLYTTDPFEIRSNVRSWLKYANVRVVGYMSPVATATATRQVMKLWTNGQPNDVSLCDHMLTADMDERVYNEQSWRQYVYQDTVGYLEPVSFPTSAQYGGSDGSVNTDTEISNVIAALEAISDPEEQLTITNGLSLDDRKRVEDYSEQPGDWTLDAEVVSVSPPQPMSASDKEAVGFTGDDGYATYLAKGERPKAGCDSITVRGTIRKTRPGQKTQNIAVKWLERKPVYKPRSRVVDHYVNTWHDNRTLMEYRRCYNTDGNRISKWIPGERGFSYVYRGALTTYYQKKGWVVDMTPTGVNAGQTFMPIDDLLGGTNGNTKGNRIKQYFSVANCHGKISQKGINGSLGYNGSGIGADLSDSKSTNVCVQELSAYHWMDLWSTGTFFSGIKRL